MQDQPSITDLIDRVSTASDGDQTSVAQIVSALGATSFLPNMMIPALAVVSPLSGVPLFSSICGLTIALVASQMLFQRDHIWLPNFVMRKHLQTRRVQTATDWMRKPAGFLDRITKERLSLLVRRPFLWITQAICLICGLVMPFLELVPFTSSLMGVVVCLFAFGMLARDGLFTLMGLAAVGGFSMLILTFIR
ncbi:exopolysaccharide biosynthesis protein [Paracoccus sp. JM45]|uniref:exopolysaccharide biosynthesis protein n=1 Tax=Paracoccus sp. JM45 TaxID=2283626 RepID=UPI000E6CF102|nr:exopolysaccharide biosynthesis protein [Paracoccus sp. JM45]RJE79387.1 exopolysaccharide biosynthesis protein [Paracoccus sp. JM45]